MDAPYGKMKCPFHEAATHNRVVDIRTIQNLLLTINVFFSRYCCYFKFHAQGNIQAVMVFVVVLLTFHIK